MIGINGQFVFGVTLGSFHDFLSLGDLMEFTIIEDAGSVLPTYLLTFKIFDDVLLSVINDGNQLQVSFGQSKDTVTNVTLSIFSHSIQPQGNNCKVITLIGLLHKPDFLTTAKLVNYSKKLSTIEVIKMVAARNFQVVSNVTKSYNPHVNIQPNITDKEFLNKIWTHADLGDSFPVVGINVRGEFMVHDFKKLLQAGHKWKIGMDKDAIEISPDYISSSNAGFVNAQYVRKATTVSMDTNPLGVLGKYLGNPNPLKIVNSVKSQVNSAVEQVERAANSLVNAVKAVESDITLAVNQSVAELSRMLKKPEVEVSIIVGRLKSLDSREEALSELKSLMNSAQNINIDIHLNDGDVSSILGKADPLMILGKSLNRGNLPSIRNITGLKIPSLPGVKNSMPAFINDNVSSTYATAHLSNTQRLASFSSNKLTLTLLPHQYIPISVLDIVMFKQPHSNRHGSAEQESGLYVVTKVARTIENSMFLTTLQLSREGMNSQQGDFR